MEKYNITPVVLPFIGVKQDEKKNKMIQINIIFIWVFIVIILLNINKKYI